MADLLEVFLSVTDFFALFHPKKTPFKPHSNPPPPLIRVRNLDSERSGQEVRPPLACVLQPAGFHTTARGVSLHRSCVLPDSPHGPSSMVSMRSVFHFRFRVHVPDLAHAHDVLYLNLVFVRTCPRVFLCVCVYSVRLSSSSGIRSLNVVSSFLLPRIKARSCFNCWSTHNHNPRLYALALSLELVRSHNFQLFLKLSKSVQAPRTPGQDQNSSNIGFTLGNLSALEDCR